MMRQIQNGVARVQDLFPFFSINFAGIILVILSGCGPDNKSTVAVIPQTEGVPLWDSVHVGAETAARHADAAIYWNAAMREDDIEAQIDLVDSVVDRKFGALVLAPDHPLALITPVERALSHGIPTAIIDSPLALTPSANLVNVINDDEIAGQIAATRAVNILHGTGKIAIIGMNPDLSSTMIRARALERALSATAPGISIVDKREGSYNVPREEQVVEEVLQAHPDLDLIIALLWNSADGAIRTLDSMKDRPHVKLIAFDSYSPPPFDHTSYLDSVIQENNRAIAQRAVELVLAMKQHQGVPSAVKLPPILITRDNAGSQEIRQLFSTELPASSWHWSSIQ